MVFYGYYVEFGETEASKGDMFLVDGTDSIRSSVTNKECGDYCSNKLEWCYCRC